MTAMATHSDRCTADPATCFGHKVEGIGYDGRHLTKRTNVEGEHSPSAGFTTEHRDGRVDATATPRSITIKTRKER